MHGGSRQWGGRPLASCSCVIVALVLIVGQVQ
jgi:hypothetical protein